jgi:LPXTG-motif cell wall-anchored protein
MGAAPVRTVLQVIGAMAISVVGFSGVAGAQQPYPPTGACRINLSSAVVTGGQSIVVQVPACSDGYGPGELVDITFASKPVSLGTVTTDATGAFSAQVTIPRDASPGTHTISTTGRRADGSTLVLTTSITVAGRDGGARAGSSAGALPFTGSSNALSAVWIALAVLVLGAALVIGARRRATVRNHQRLSDS